MMMVKNNSQPRFFVRRAILPLLASLAILIAGCDSDAAPATATPPVAPATAVPTTAATATTGVTPTPAALAITSDAFAAGQAIPQLYSCDGDNTSPALAWNAPPAGTQSLALLLDDPDAPSGTFVHWVVFNLPPTILSLHAAVAEGQTGPDGSIQGRNGAGQNAYTGPCPPSGTHHYHFKLYALDTMLTLPASAPEEDVLRASAGHILAQGDLIGTYAR